MTAPELLGEPCVCPQCYLDPSAVPEGAPVPRRIAPGRIRCPDCEGLVFEEPPEEEPRARPKRHPQGLDSQTILECFLEQMHCVEPDGSGDSSSGPKKPRPRREKSRAEAQDPLGFPERLRSTTRRLSVPVPVTVRVSREQEVWLQQLAAKYRTGQTEVVTAAVAWFLRAQPVLDRRKVRSNWQARRRTSIKLEPNLWAALRTLADTQELARTGAALALVLDYCTRKRVDVLGQRG